jgi:hypothetical protein
VGGYGSGRRGGRPSVEASWRIDVRRLKRWGYLKPNCTTIGEWSWSRWGETAGTVRVSCTTSDEVGGHLNLSFTVRGAPVVQHIAMEWVPMRFGGRRWYCICPDSGRRCTVLVLPNGGRHFASVKAWRLPYASQSEDAIGRAHRRIAKAERRLEGLSKYARIPTREKLWQRISDAEEVLDHGTMRLMARFLARDPKLRERLR